MQESASLEDVGSTAATITGTTDYTGPLGDIVSSFESVGDADNGLNTAYFETTGDEAASDGEALSQPSPTQYGVFFSPPSTAEPPTSTTYTISSSGTGSESVDSGGRYSRVPVRRRKPDNAVKNRRRRVNRCAYKSSKDAAAYLKIMWRNNDIRLTNGSYIWTNLVQSVKLEE